MMQPPLKCASMLGHRLRVVKIRILIKSNQIRVGMQYANLLSMFGRHIETERLAAKLAPASRRVHGPDHTITIDTNELLNKCKKRCIVVLPENKLFHALRYESGGTVCVANGPIMYPRNKNNERTYKFENHLVMPAISCPVICNGLVSASHLNGELGEVRNFQEKNEHGIRCVVCFEKKGVKSALVKPENLRIAFALPDEVV